MPLNALGWPHLLIILVVILLLFGAPKLPGLAKSLGQSMRIFRKEVSTMKDEAADDKRPSSTVVEESAPVASSGAGPSTAEPSASSLPGTPATGTSHASQPKP
jgi:sec-independent protein translocase protein TatA